MKSKYFLIALSLCCLSQTLKAEGIGYDTVADAIEQLKQKDGTKTSVQGGWTIIEDSQDTSMVLWSFTPDIHPAHPTAVKRKVVERDNKIYIHMTALCQAEKVACDKLMSEFEKLNKQIMGSE
ncbi:molecular chaperone DnaJ [Aliiglaciecola sp. 3_MG-2023]|uniref:molecular chaperone DnaJ n=1 Tax=Aliiglaciecola sp. 3_MG-2023 TaxID=3062644 RepID=UPI0026E18501|nr:molecular chaperone DnaJ [Aliiglaciecola sp. 3_MG-2023]MDO6692674.1 molecular chaperone DnaJ [Aliiglaciecola sp. 3_MG-2023]